MPATTPMPTKNPGDVLTSALWNTYLRDNIDKLLTRGHRVLTVAQFGALTSPEGTKGTVAPDEVYLEVDSTNGIQWHLAYESGEPTYKWRFLGGPPMQLEVATGETTTSAAFVDLATVMSLTLPRGGDFEFGVYATASGSASATLFAALKFGAAATSGTDGIRMDGSAAGQAISGGRQFVRAALASALVVKLQFASNGAATGTFLLRNMTIRPVRLI